MQSKTFRIAVLVIVVALVAWFAYSKTVNTDVALEGDQSLAATAASDSGGAQDFTITPGVLKARRVDFNSPGVPDTGIYVMQYTITTGSNVGGISFIGVPAFHTPTPHRDRTMGALTITSTANATDEPQSVKAQYSPSCNYSPQGGATVGPNSSCTVTLIISAVAKSGGRTGLRLTQIEYLKKPVGSTRYNPAVLRTTGLEAIKTPDVQLNTH